MKGQSTGMTGVYYVAAELSRRNYTALVTTRNTRAVDILAMNDNTLRTVGVQVKTNSTTSPHDFWLVGEKDYEMEDSKLNNIVYVLVNLEDSGPPAFFVVGGRELKSKISKDQARTGSVWYSVKRKDIPEGKNNWGVFDSLTK